MVCEHRLYEFKTKIVRQRRCPEKVRPLTVYQKAKVIKNLLCASAKLPRHGSDKVQTYSERI
jgi:hypothetical protein